MLVFFEASVLCLKAQQEGVALFDLISQLYVYTFHLKVKCKKKKRKKAYKRNGHRVNTRPLCLDYGRAGKKNKGQNVFIILILSLRCQLRGQVRQRNVSKVQEMQDIKNYLG